MPPLFWLKGSPYERGPSKSSVTRQPSGAEQLVVWSVPDWVEPEMVQVPELGGISLGSNGGKGDVRQE